MEAVMDAYPRRPVWQYPRIWPVTLSSNEGEGTRGTSWLTQPAEDRSLERWYAIRLR